MNYYNENDPYAANWLRALISKSLIAPGIVDERSITEINADELTEYTQCHFFAGIGGWSLALRLAGWPDDETVWTGSCPCQPFSGAGKGQVDKDERHLWPTFRGLIAKRKPPVVFGEQVASADGKIWLAALRADLEAVGYAVGCADLCAAGVGAPQIRQRLWWVADANNSGRKGAEWQGQQNQAWQERAAACRQSMRSNRGPWPPGPGALDHIPLLANGLPGTMGGCKGYGNAIVPQVACEFISAWLDTSNAKVSDHADSGRGA